MQRIAATLCLWLLACSGAVLAQPILDVRLVPRLGAAGVASYPDFLLVNLPRAFASASDGSFGWQGGSGTLEAARERALASCAAKGGTDCTIYAENLDVVRPGLASLVPSPPGPLAATWNYAVVPDARYFWRGPATASGVYVWAHGLGSLNGGGPLADARGSQPQGHVRAFNNAGFDVVRFDRDPNADLVHERTAGWLEDVLGDLRKRGYRRIVVGGQSRGGWNALQMLRRPGLADVVVAVSAGAHGMGASTNLPAQYDDMRRMVSDVVPGGARLVFVQFAADPYAGDLPGRAALVERLRPKLGGLLVIDRPEGFSGHFGGAANLFTKRYAACILAFATAPVPPTSCPQAPS